MATVTVELSMSFLLLQPLQKSTARRTASGHVSLRVRDSPLSTGPVAQITWAYDVELASYDQYTVFRSSRC